MTTVLVAGIAMFLADVAQGLYVLLLARPAGLLPARGGRVALWWAARRWKLAAGLADGLADVFLGLAVAGASTTLLSVDPAGHLHPHVRAVTLGAQAALVAGSIGGADVADRLASWACPSSPPRSL